MNAFRPFFLVIQRPLVLFGAIGWMIIATFLIGQLVRQGGNMEQYMDAVFLTVVILSVYSGWIIGSCVLELQQSTFMFLLPGGSYRLLPGFLLFGAGMVLGATLLVNAASPAPQDSALLFAFGLASFVTGASIRDPLSGFLTGLGIVLFLLLIVTSGYQAQLAREHPAFLLLLSAALIATGLYRLFSRHVTRIRSVNKGRPVLNFSSAELVRASRERQLDYGPKRSKWRHAYLGGETRGWLKAAWHETYGGQRTRTLLKSITASWGLFLILLIEAGKHRDQLGLWKSFCWVVHDGLMRAPHPLLTGERSGAFVMVAAVIIIGGSSMALWRPVSLSEGLFHPLSRRQRADVFFNGGYLDLAILVLGVAPLLYLLGQGAGVVAGVTPQFDYLPFFFRVILVTLILMPFAYWGGLKLRSTAGQGDRYSMVGIALGMSVFSVSAMLLVFLSNFLFPSPWIELVVLLFVLLFSRMLLRARLRIHFQTADLC